jgi:hypothetical protein
MTFLQAHDVVLIVDVFQSMSGVEDGNRELHITP